MQALDTYITRKFQDNQLIEVQIIKKKNSTSLNNYVRQFGKVVQIPSNGSVWIKLESKKVIKFSLEHIRVVGVSMKKNIDREYHDDTCGNFIEEYPDEDYFGNTLDVDYPEEEYYEDGL